MNHHTYTVATFAVASGLLLVLAPSRLSSQAVPAPAERPCVVGIASAKTTRNTSASGTVSFTIRNVNCTSGSVKIGLGPSYFKGDLLFKWSPAPPVDVPLPKAGTTSDEYRFDFVVESGRGSVRFEVASVECAGDTVCRGNIRVEPDLLEAPEELTFP